MKLNFRCYETKTLAELDKLNDKLVEELGALEQKFAVIRQSIDPLKAAQRNAESELLID